MHRNLKRLALVDKYTVYKVWENHATTPYLEIENHQVSTYSDRYENFYKHGFTCSCCGLVATFAAIEIGINDKTPHINVYAVNEQGQEILFTKDHIYPRSLGGKNHIDNYQVMCSPCNARKQNYTTLTPEEACQKGYISKEMIEYRNTKTLLEEQQALLRKQISELSKTLSTVDKKLRTTINNIGYERNKENRGKEEPYSSREGPKTYIN